MSLNNLDFYQQTYLNLWFEFVKETIIPIIERFEIDITDKMRTFTEHIAVQIAILTHKKELLTGGAYNDFLSNEYNFIYLR
jgi:anhydro-N-acetylmuramic acid kinase